MDPYFLLLLTEFLGSPDRRALGALVSEVRVDEVADDLRPLRLCALAALEVPVAFLVEEVDALAGVFFAVTRPDSCFGPFAPADVAFPDDDFFPFVVGFTSSFSCSW